MCGTHLSGTAIHGLLYCHYGEPFLLLAPLCKERCPSKRGKPRGPHSPLLSDMCMQLLLNPPIPQSSFSTFFPPRPLSQSFPHPRRAVWNLQMATLCCSYLQGLVPAIYPPAPNPLPLSHACEAPLHPPRVTIETTSPISICSSEMNGAHKVCRGFGSLR